MFRVYRLIGMDGYGLEFVARQTSVHDLTQDVKLVSQPSVKLTHEITAESLM
jgi:hypothetical protein